MSQVPIIIQQKQNGAFGKAMKFIGYVCFICCVCSLLSAYFGNNNRRVEEGIDASDRREPIIKGMTVTTRDTIDITTDNKTKKEAKIGVYNNCDCESDEVHVTNLAVGQPLDVEGQVNIEAENKWKCVKGYNVKLIDYTHSFTGTKDGEQMDGSMTLSEYNMMNPIKVGCEPGEDFSTQSLNFKWKVVE